MNKLHIEYLHLVGIDNVLVKPLDPLFIGYFIEKNCDISCKCVSRSALDEE